MAELKPESLKTACMSIKNFTMIDQYSRDDLPIYRQDKYSVIQGELGKNKHLGRDEPLFSG